jgi:hypothetical protein
MPTQQPKARGRGAATNAARFGRPQQAPQAGRFGRNVQLQNASGRRTSTSSSSGRSLPLVSRNTTTRGKSRGKSTSSSGLLGALTKALPSAGAAKTVTKRGGGRPAGLALAAAAAGMAFRNRDKIAGMVGRGKQQSTTTDTTLNNTTDTVVVGQPQPTPPTV